MKRFAVFALIGLLPSAAFADLSVAGPEKVSESDRVVLQGALQILMNRCPKLDAYGDRLKDVRVDFLPSYVSENLGLAKSRGWGRMVELTATVKGDAKLPKGWDGWNHTLSWRMGGGEKPGILIVKPQAARFCDRDRGDVMIDAPLSFIK